MPFLRFGKEENVLAVRVDNSRQPDALHVAHWGTFVRTPLVSDTVARVEVLTQTQNDGDALKDCVLVTTVVDAEGEVAGAAESRHPSAPGQSRSWPARLDLKPGMGGGKRARE